MRIATWNVNSITVRLERLLAWLERSQTDVLCLQELKCDAAAFPTAALRAAGYEAAVHADGRWNGVAVLSRVGLTDVVQGLAGGPAFNGSAEPRAVAASCGGVRVWSVYVPNGREVGHPHFAYKLAWLSALRETVAADAAGGTPFAVLGDFNVAPTDHDVWDIAEFEGATHVTEAERTALAELRGVGLADVLPRPLKYERPFSYWDYRQLCFPKNRGMRIDLVYGNAPFVAAVSDAYVDRDERKGKGASDHAPVVVDLAVAAG
ncbi:exodeoxyribonuclease III [Streptomyces sp. DSM 44915]|uniref:Exodeoxyribonuclease III n=1 Tax=Streptomyces chisholmiae TaxID=3075540 RepID=A0ABU2JN29_9ACTN|nr:exodeoxyribonuclease III [Streptomyces sp. DSM 44915]MDT0266382.1 exodeoxyribonuclease III [Streptomyces sp. DSM 44915]